MNGTSAANTTLSLCSPCPFANDPVGAILDWALLLVAFAAPLSTNGYCQSGQTMFVSNINSKCCCVPSTSRMIQTLTRAPSDENQASESAKFKISPYANRIHLQTNDGKAFKIDVLDGKITISAAIYPKAQDKKIKKKTT